MVWHGGSSAGSYLADPTSPIPSHCASIVVTSTLRVNIMEPFLAVTMRMAFNTYDLHITFHPYNQALNPTDNWVSSLHTVP